MISQTFVMLIGLAIAGWGHFLVHDLRGASDAWCRADSRFPPVLRTAPSFAGAVLLTMGALLVLVPAVG